MHLTHVGLLIVIMKFIIITASSTTNDTTPDPQSIRLNCDSHLPIANKFFVLGDLLFFTSEGDYFESFRVMNLSSGVSTAELEVSKMLPVTASNSLLWAFLYDPVNCRVTKTVPEHLTFDQDRYCARVVNLRGLVVARLLNQTVLFLRSNNGKFILTSDTVHYIEMSATLKHIDKSGFTSSLTFVQQSNQYVSTHYGRHGQICITTVLHQRKCKYIP